ncbi:MAG: LysR family transcriptional regulator [Ilumatobacteraceae bacterium]
MSRTPLPDISIRQLEYLVAVSDAPTWSSAARTVGVSASALSQGLAELERRVGVVLFEPVGRRRTLRPSARPVLDHARQVVSLTADLASWSSRLQTASSGHVRLGLIDVAAVVHFPDVLRHFRSEHPDVDLVLVVAPSAALLDDLRAGRLDVVVCVEPPEPVPGIEITPLLHEPLIVYAPGGSVIGANAEWGPWVLFPHGSHTRRAVAHQLGVIGAPLHVAAESHQPDVLIEMVALGLGWTVLPKPHDDGWLDHVVEGPELVRRSIVLARRSGSVHDPAADELAGRLLVKRDEVALNRGGEPADRSAR